MAKQEVPSTRPRLIPYNNEIYIDYGDDMSLVCREHMMRVDELEKPAPSGVVFGEPTELPMVRCLEGPHRIFLDKTPSAIRKLLSRRLDSKKYQEAEIFDIDGYLVPASKEKQLKTKGSEYAITAQVKKSDKKGEQIVIYVGKKGIQGKSQIFVDPKYGKLTFDQNDINPKDIFVKLEATFRDGAKASIERPDRNDE